MLSRYVVSQVKHNSYFLVGLALGLWVSLVVVPLEEESGAACASALGPPPRDDYEPQREERPLGPAPRTQSRTLQRPRYYSTELGMRGTRGSPMLTLTTLFNRISHVAVLLQVRSSQACSAQRRP